MATLQDTDRLLQNTTDSLKTYSKAFNNASKEVTADVEYMGKSIDDLRTKLNTLMSDATKLNELGKNININDKGQVDDYTNKVKELDKTLSSMVTDISGSLKELNGAFEREFRVADGIDEQTGKIKYTAGYLKEQLNDLARVYSGFALRDVKQLAPDLGTFAENFTKQVDQIEYQMGRLTEFGKNRSETDKALGFEIAAKDIADTREAKVAKLNELDDIIKSLGISGGINDSALKLEDPETFKEVEGIKTYISQLDASIGRRLKGYIDMFNEAQNLLKAGQANENLFSVVGSLMSRSMYEDAVGDKIDWSKVTNKDLTNWDNKLEENLVSQDFDEFITSAPKVAASFEDIQKAVADTNNVTKEYGTELQKVVSEATVLSDAQKTDILGADYSKKIDEYRNRIQWLKDDIKTLGQTKLENQPETRLDVNDANEAQKLVQYKARIEEATEALDNLKTQQAELFKNAGDPAKAAKAGGQYISKDKLSEVRNVLESGYKVNLLEGSADKEKLDQLREGFEQLIKNFKDYKLDIIPDSELENLAKINALQDKIKSETSLQEKTAQAQANYENDKLAYLTKQKEILQAQANLKALISTRDTLLASASSANNIEATRYVKDKNGNIVRDGLYGPPKTEKYITSEKNLITDRYSEAIVNENKAIADAQKVINKLKQEFSKYNLEIPVTPVVDMRPNLKGQIKQDYMGITRANRDEILGGLGGYDNDLKQLSQRASELGINIDKSNSRIQAIGNTIRTAFGHGDIDKAHQLLTVYGAEVDKLKNKVDGQAKAQDIAAKRQKEAIKSLLEETKNYVSTQEALNNKNMSYADQAAYYEQQLSKFEDGTREYIEVLKLKNQAENKAAEEAQKAAEKEKQAHLEALEAAKQRVTGILSIIKSLADGINSAVNRIVQIIRTGISLVNRIISTAGKIVNTLASGVRSIITLFGSLSNRVRQIFGSADKSASGLNGSMNLLKGSATELRSKIMLLKGAFNAVFNNQFINKGKSLLTSIATMNVVIGQELTNSTIEWAQELERALGISATDLLTDLKEISAVLYGLGMSSEDTALGAQNLGMMSRYLGMMGLAGGDVDAVMTKLASGMKGMTQAIDDLGLSVRDSQMQDFIKNLKNGTNELGKSLREQGVDLSNMGDDFSALNEKARVYIRYATIIEQFKSNYDLSNFAKQLNTVTGRLSILSQTWSSLATGIGVEFAKVGAIIAGYLIPIIKRLQVYLLGTVQVVNGVEVQIEGLVHRIQALINKIGSFFGIDIGIKLGESLHAGLNNLNNADTSGIDDTNDKLEETAEKLDEVSDKAKKAGGNLQSFDRINNISTSSDSSSSADDFDYSVLMNSALDSLKAYTDTVDNYFDILDKNLTNTVNKIKEKLKEVADELTGRELDFGFDNDKIKTNLGETWNNILKLIKGWGSLVVEIGLKIADDVNIGEIITKLTDLLAKASEVAKVITDVLIPAFRAFYDIALSPIVKYIVEQVVKAIDFMIEELDKWEKWFTDNKENILQFFIDLAEIVNAAWEVIKSFLDTAWDKLGESISKLGEKLRNALDSLMDNTNENKPAIIEWIQTELPGIIENGIKKIKEFWDALRGKESLNTVAENQGTVWGEFLQILMDINFIIKALRPLITELVGAFAEFSKNELIPWINEKLGELGLWLNQNKNKIAEFIDKIAGATWEGFKIFVDLLGKIIDYVVQNPDSIFTFFKALIGLKVASWFVSTAAGIGMAITGLKGLTGFVSGAGSTLSGLFGGGAAAATGAAATGAAAGAGTATGAGTAAGGAAAAGGVALGPILAVVAAVVALIAAIKDLWDTSESFREAIKGIWDNIVESFNSAKEKISAAFGNIKEAWDNFYQSYENSNLKAIIESLVTLIAEYLGGALSSVIDLIGNLFGAIGNLLADTINIVAGVLDVLGGLANIIIGIFTLDGEKIKQGWGELVTGLVEIVQGLIQGIIDVIGGVVGAVIDIGSSIVGGLGQGISDAWQGFVEWLRGLFDGWIQSVKDFFGIHSPSTVFADIGDFLVQGLLQGIQNAWTAFSETVIGLFNGLVDGIKNTFSSIGEFFSKTFNNAKELAVNAWSNASEKFIEVKNKVVNAFDGVKENIKTTFTTAKDNAVNVWNDAKSKFTTVADNIASGLGSIKDKAKQIFTDVKNSASSILSGIGTQLSNTWDGIKSTVSTGWSYVTGNTKATTGKTITSHAVGGSIAGGQLFIANENGNAELIGNIDGSGKTNVANNNMIMQAMESGIFEAVYNAMAEVMNQRGTVGNSGNTTIKLDGFGLIDASTLRELARILAPYLKSNDINIADTQFSI